VITADHVEQAEHDLHVFLIAASQFGAALNDCIVVADSLWDLREKALGISEQCRSAR